MVTSGGPALDPSKLMNFIILGSLWVHEALGDMLTSIVSNSHFGKRPGARDMTIFGCHVGPHIPNFVYREVYGSIRRYVEIYGGIRRYMGVWEACGLGRRGWVNGGGGGGG